MLGAWNPWMILCNFTTLCSRSVQQSLRSGFQVLQSQLLTRTADDMRSLPTMISMGSRSRSRHGVEQEDLTTSYRIACAAVAKWKTECCLQQPCVTMLLVMFGGMGVTTPMPSTVPPWRWSWREIIWSQVLISFAMVVSLGSYDKLILSETISQLEICS